VTAEEWAAYGVGEPDVDGNYPDYRVPAHLRPAAPASTKSGREIWWSDIVPRWGLVQRDLVERYQTNLHDPRVLALPWPAVRFLILGLLNEPSRLARALEA
jgi:hypothetical protein